MGSLKEKPEQRGPIATKCVEHVDAVLKQSLAKLVGKIEMHATDSAEKANAVEEAVQQVKKAEEEAEKAENEFIIASNALLEASEENKSNLRKGKDLDASSKMVASNLDVLKAEFVAAESMVARFVRVIEHGRSGACVTVVEKESADIAPHSKTDEEASVAAVQVVEP